MKLYISVRARWQCPELSHAVSLKQLAVPLPVFESELQWLGPETPVNSGGIFSSVQHELVSR